MTPLIAQNGVITGLQRLLFDPTLLRSLEGRRVALLVNPTSVDSTLTSSIDLLLGVGVQVVRLFGPEHGIRAEAQDMESVDSMRDPETNLPVVSLYGSTVSSLTPTPSDLDGIDLVIADLQDIGSRYYTYAYTVGLMMYAAGKQGVEVWVLDRPNPLGGLIVEGNVVSPECRSFVGMQPLATRHGMTLGELCLFFNRFTEWSCKLTVIKMQGWRRNLWFDETNLPWVMPSPNMPTLDTAICYPGQCLLEGSQLSEARGTTRPFEQFGAPYVNSARLLEQLRSYQLKGVLFRPVAFRPMFQKYAGITCHGLQIHVTNRKLYRSVRTSYAIIQSLIALYPQEFRWRSNAYEFVDDVPAIDLLLGSRSLRQALENGASLESLEELSRDSAFLTFLDRRNEVLLYD